MEKFSKISLLDKEKFVKIVGLLMLHSCPFQLPDIVVVMMVYLYNISNNFFFLSLCCKIVKHKKMLKQNILVIVTISSLSFYFCIKKQFMNFK